ncbi:MAG: hypothetical protein ACRC28_10035, partial [Clostridium sp.]|uniref:hypothetical protein n=1 Tax=Clostridium sp. TaxID=1506 RepID=UPI003F3A4DA5
MQDKLRKNNKTVYSTPSSTQASGSSLDNGDGAATIPDHREMDGVLSKLRNLLISDRWIEFGGMKTENAEKFLNQFLEVEDTWTSTKLLKMVRSKLKARAQLWFDAHYGEAIQTYEDFKCLFRRRYAKELDEPKHKLMFWKYLLEGPRYKDIISYMCKLRIHAEKSEERFESAKDKLLEIFQDGKYREYLALVEDWRELLEVCEENEVNM